MHDDLIYRDSVLLRDVYTYVSTQPQYTPLHFSGATLLLSNLSSVVTSILQVLASANGVTFLPINIYSPQVGAVAQNITLIPLGMGLISFISAQPYIRFQLGQVNPDCVACHLVQWSPRVREPAYG